MNTISVAIRRLAYRAISLLDGKANKRCDVIILCYHSVADDPWTFSEAFSALTKQIDYLLTIRTPISLEDLEMYMNGKDNITSPSFIITFDDGYENVLQTREYFQKKQIKPALFVLSNPERANRGELNNNLPFLSIDQIKTLKNAGWTIGVHSATHADFKKIDTEAQKIEIQDAKKILENDLGFSLYYFSYPKGVYSKTIIDKVKKSGYSMAVSMDDGFINTETDRYIVPRIGVNQTHTFDEFKILFSPSVIWLRGVLKKFITL